MYDSHFGYKQNIPKKTLVLLTSLSLLFFRFPDEVHNPRLGHFFRSPDEVHSFKGLRSVTSSGPQTRSRTSRHLVRPLLQAPDEVQNFKGPRSATSSITLKDLVRPLSVRRGLFFFFGEISTKSEI
jgi:hypothetical protein